VVDWVEIGNARLALGDCRDILRTLPAESVDSIVTDPPYELGFMGKAWDGTGIANDVGMWREVLRVLKPGAHLLAFSGSRTYHRMVCAIEDAGFEIRDQIMWLYGSGFPKSLDVSKAIDRAAGKLAPEGQGFTVAGYSHNPDKLLHTAPSRGYVPPLPATPEAERWQGWGTALKPAHEPIVVARKPLIGTVAANVLAHGTGALNIDGCRVGDFVNTTPSGVDRRNAKLAALGYRPGEYQQGETTPSGALGRWPANVIHDGSEEVVGMFPESPGAIADVPLNSRKTKDVYGKYDHNSGMPARGDNGSAARFFYCAKASRDERGPGNNHPTVKPLALIQYLVKLVTPPGGIVLDPFCGSGTLGIAAGKLGMKWQGIELNPKYIEIAERRIEREVGLLLDMEAAHAD